MLRINSTLPPETEELVTRVIGCCIEVHRALGTGLLEGIYSRAAAIELDRGQIAYEREKLLPVFYRGQLLCNQRLDFVVADQIVLEIKCVERFNPIHRSQLMTYLRLSKLRVGLLINFNVEVLRDGIKRIVL